MEISGLILVFVRLGQPLTDLPTQHCFHSDSHTMVAIVLEGVWTVEVVIQVFGRYTLVFEVLNKIFLYGQK